MLYRNKRAQEIIGLYTEERQKISNLEEVYITGGKSESLWKENACCNTFKFIL